MVVGLLHDVMKDFMITNYGTDKWEKALAKAKSDESIHFHKFHRYDKSMTKPLFEACLEGSGLKKEEAMEAIGRHFIKYNKEKAHGNLVQILGIDFFQFCQSLNYVYWFLTDFAYKGMTMPTFRAEREDMTTINLHYFGRYPGLQSLIVGFLKEAAKELYDLEVAITLVETKSQKIDDNTTQDHSIFKIVADKEIFVTYVRPITWPNYHSVHSIPDFPDSLQITPYYLCKVFPYHLVYDNKMVIRQMGINLQRLCARYQVIGSKLNHFFRAIHPCVPLFFENIVQTQNMVYILETKQDEYKYLPYLVLKGQMMWMPVDRYGIFMSSLLMTTVTDLTFNHLTMNDLFLYDSTRELIVFNYLRNIEITKCQNYEDSLTIEIQKVRTLLKENLKTNNMMVMMDMPNHIIEKLRDNIRVDIEELPDVSILVGYIVDFNNHTANIKPMEVITMVYNLYEKFEHVAAINHLMKCEATGHSFIYVGGLSDLDTKHAHSAADAGLGMLLLAQDILWPGTQIPVEVRLGIHSGPVVSAIIGSKPRRYAIYGETIILASRMATHSQPSKIQITEATYGLLKGHHYLLEPRGIIDVLGFQKMFTYWLLANLEKSDEELKGIGTKVEDDSAQTDEDKCCKSKVCVTM